MKPILFFILFPIVALSQNTKTKIEGFAKFKLGMTDSALLADFPQAQLINNAERFDFADKDASLDSGGNFCNQSTIYFIPKYIVTEGLEVNNIFLTFFKRKLIDIRITQCLEDKKLKDLLIAKYGDGYKKKYGLYLEMLVQKYAKQGIPRQKIIDDFGSYYTFAIIWDDGNSTISQGVQNDYYDFAKGIMIKEQSNILTYGVAVTNKKRFLELIACSNSGRQIRYAEYLKNAKKASTVL